MTQRLNTAKVAPKSYAAMMGLENFVKAGTLGHGLVHLVKVRASYMNGCAYCIDMHTKDARAAGETEQRLFAVPVWRETPFFTPRERAALAFTEAVTEIGRQGVPDALYRETSEHFTEPELVELTMAVVAINAWNRLAITFQIEPGSYQTA